MADSPEDLNLSVERTEKRKGNKTRAHLQRPEKLHSYGPGSPHEPSMMGPQMANAHPAGMKKRTAGSGASSGFSESGPSSLPPLKMVRVLMPQDAKVNTCREDERKSGTRVNTAGAFRNQQSTPRTSKSSPSGRTRGRAGLGIVYGLRSYVTPFPLKISKL